jgi:hypothetical protein
MKIILISQTCQLSHFTPAVIFMGYIPKVSFLCKNIVTVNRTHKPYSLSNIVSSLCTHLSHVEIF